MNGEHQYQYQEIDLIDYIRIILKKKKVILVFILLGIIVAWAMTLSIPKTYKAETFLEIGNVLNPLILVEKINYGFYGDYSGLGANNAEGTNLVRIEISSSNTKAAEDNLNKVNELILEKHNQKLEDKKIALEKTINELEEKIQSLFWQGKRTESFEIEIYHLKNQINDFQPTEVIREPTIIFSREPNLYLNLLFGAVLGAFVGIFILLSRQWWQRNKERLYS